jgi:hypothetical protein
MGMGEECVSNIFNGRVFGKNKFNSKIKIKKKN